jgi:hypothetical protein
MIALDFDGGFMYVLFELLQIGESPHCSSVLLSVPLKYSSGFSSGE